MKETVKFSELPAGQYLGHDGNIITKEIAEYLIMRGKCGALATISEEFIQDILDQAYADLRKGIKQDDYTSEQLGKPVEIDVIPGEIRFKGGTKHSACYIDLTEGKIYKTLWSDPYDRGYYDEDRIITVIDDVGDEHHIFEGDYTVISLVNEQEV
ncbi:hypothetical protein CPT_Stahl3 [Bacillus phage Stahl]|uniref:Uncharacterized protein n=1 Tax=Bacillus phage Stahl TaxID=1610832 RepID=A0A0E3M2V4_9CAUD|nr:hypothetical protein CPT_Stahl3 [Bacillus phage Stahl]AKA61431.1 hypothetical protein CPT_Stahl3 [Bacillus phage Stahl]